jgi:uncharacterized protein (TIGR02271 family)
MPNYEQTELVAVYDDPSEAERAENELIQNGFDRSNVRVTRGQANRTFAAGSSVSTEPAYEGTHEGGISGFFNRLFGHDDADSTSEEHRQYRSAFDRGAAVLSVTVHDDRIEEASEILNRYNPVDFDQRVPGDSSDEYPSSGTGTATAFAGEMSNAATGERTIPVVEEDLKIGKRAVQRGGVRVYSRVVEQPVDETVNLREERVRVNRRPVDRPATDADFGRQDEVIEVVETAEEPVIQKSARVVEEVVIGKEATERTQNVHDTVRRTDVEVEQLDPTDRGRK